MRKLERLIQRIKNIRICKKGIIFVADDMASVCVWNTVANTCSYKTVPENKLYDPGALPPDSVIIIDNIPEMGV